MSTCTAQAMPTVSCRTKQCNLTAMLVLGDPSRRLWETTRTKLYNLQWPIVSQLQRVRRLTQVMSHYFQTFKEIPEKFNKAFL